MNLLQSLALMLKAHLAYGLIAPSKSGTVTVNEYIDPDLANIANTVFRGRQELPDQAMARLDAIENNLGLQAGSSRVDVRSGRVASLSPGQPILPGKGLGTGGGADAGKSTAHGRPNWSKLGLDAVKQLMIENKDYLDIDAIGELFVDGTPRTAVHSDGEMIQFHLPRTFNGIPVMGARVAATIKKVRQNYLSY